MVRFDELTSAVSFVRLLYCGGMYISPTGSGVPLERSNLPGMMREAVISTDILLGSHLSVYAPLTIGAEYAFFSPPTSRKVIRPSSIGLPSNVTWPVTVIGPPPPQPAAI